MNRKIINIIIFPILTGLFISCSSSVRFSSSEGKKNNTVVSKTQPNSISIPSDVSHSRNIVLNEAAKWLGTPYKWGGENMAGADCSGFVMRVYEKAGVKLPRTARDIFDYAELIKGSEIEAGDLVFFKNGSRISHVGIYTGAGQMIHSSSSRGVVQESISKNYYTAHFAGFGRVLD